MKYPGVQEAHAVKPSDMETLPASHAIHDVAPVTLEYNEALHKVQTVLFINLLYLPVSH